MAEDKNQREGLFRIIVINIICLLIYTVALNIINKDNNKEFAIYTTNAKSVHEALYRKVMSGEISIDEFKRTIKRMETNLKKAIPEKNAVIVAKKAIVLGGKEILFTPHGDITEKKKINRIQGNIQDAHPGKNTLQQAIKDFKKSMEREKTKDDI